MSLLSKSTTINELKAQLNFWVRTMRKSEIKECVDFTKPQLAEDDKIFFNGKLFKRKRILLLTKGCMVASCTMCPLPNEAMYGVSKTPTEEDIIHQFESSFTKSSINDFEIINIYTNGNFFDDGEISSKLRKQIYSRVQKSRATILMVESLPQFINFRKIVEAKKYLREKKLVVCMGLESADDLVRELCVNSTCTKPFFERAVRLLKKFDYPARVFLMIKPPFLTEKEAVEDAIKSIRYLSILGISDPTLCPTRVSPHTLVNMLYARGKFRPPWLWSIVEILKNTHNDSSPRIATSNLKPERSPASSCAKNCYICNNRLIKEIEQFNITRDFGKIEGITCDCYKNYRKFLITENRKLSGASLKERVAQFLQELQYDKLHT